MSNIKTAVEELIELNPESQEACQWALDEALLAATKQGRLDEVKALIQQGANAKNCSSLALFYAAKIGAVEMVEFLIPQSAPYTLRARAIITAAQGKHPAVLEKLLPHILPLPDGEKEDAYALKVAAEFGCAECIKMLLPYSSPKHFRSEALFAAANHNQLGAVKELLAVSDVNDSGALMVACAKGYLSCVKELWSHASTPVKLEALVACFEKLQVPVLTFILEQAHDFEDPSLLELVSKQSRFMSEQLEDHALRSEEKEMAGLLFAFTEKQALKAVSAVSPEPPERVAPPSMPFRARL